MITRPVGWTTQGNPVVWYATTSGIVRCSEHVDPDAVAAGEFERVPQEHISDFEFDLGQPFPTLADCAH